MMCMMILSREVCFCDDCAWREPSLRPTKYYKLVFDTDISRKVGECGWYTPPLRLNQTSSSTSVASLGSSFSALPQQRRQLWNRISSCRVQGQLWILKGSSFLWILKKTYVFLFFPRSWHVCFCSHRCCALWFYGQSWCHTSAGHCEIFAAQWAWTVGALPSLWAREQQFPQKMNIWTEHENSYEHKHNTLLLNSSSLRPTFHPRIHWSGHGQTSLAKRSLCWGVSFDMPSASLTATVHLESIPDRVWDPTQPGSWQMLGQWLKEVLSSNCFHWFPRYADLTLLHQRLHQFRVPKGVTTTEVQWGKRGHVTTSWLVFG